MATDTRRRMIVTTSKLLERQGFHGTGLNQILEEANAPKGSMYFHFPGGKTQLAAEAIAAAADYIDRALRTHEGGSAIEAVDGYLGQMARWLESTEFSGGCPIATTALEVGATTPELGTRSWREQTLCQVSETSMRCALYWAIRPPPGLRGSA